MKKSKFQAGFAQTWMQIQTQPLPLLCDSACHLTSLCLFPQRCNNSPSCGCCEGREGRVQNASDGSVPEHHSIAPQTAAGSMMVVVTAVCSQEPLCNRKELYRAPKPLLQDNHTPAPAGLAQLQGHWALALLPLGATLCFRAQEWTYLSISSHP